MALQRPLPRWACGQRSPSRATGLFRRRRYAGLRRRMLRRGFHRQEDGQLTVLMIGYTFIAAVLVLVGVDASKVFLARRALASVADSAALAGAQAIDRAAVYRGDVRACRGVLPIDGATADH